MSPATVRWAIQRAEISVDELAGRLKDVNASQVLAWMRGDSPPRFSQAERLAEKLRIPLAVLFMEIPPDFTVPIPDLRTIANAQAAKPSLEFLDALNDALIKQQWYREFQEDQETPQLSFVSKFTPYDDVAVVAKDMRATLGINNKFRRETGSWQQFLTSFVRQAEALGVLVMRGSVVRHDVTRKLKTKEFRGFAVSDSLAPLVFINAADAKAAQIFTLAHELAHIWIGESGISNINPKKRRWQDSRSEVEQFCNHVAAEFLVPKTNFDEFWNRGGDALSRIRSIATFHRVSVVVALMRAYELQKIDYQFFSEMMDAEYARFRRQEQQAAEQEQETKGNFWATFTARNGQRLINSVLKSFREGRLLYTEGAGLLGLKVKTFTKYLQKHAGE